MEKTVFGYVWQYSRPQQIVMTLMSAASLPFLYLYYEVPKTIINQAIGTKGVTKFLIKNINLKRLKKIKSLV